jgi:hypothetical protein
MEEMKLKTAKFVKDTDVQFAESMDWSRFFNSDEGRAWLKNYIHGQFLVYQRALQSSFPY